MKSSSCDSQARSDQSPVTREIILIRLTPGTQLLTGAQNPTIRSKNAQRPLLEIH